MLFASCGKHAEPAATGGQATNSRQIQVIPAPQVAYPPAKIKIIAPREGEVLKNSKDSVRIVMQVIGMKLGVPTDADSTLGIAYAKLGQHIHVIVDDHAYMADFKNGQPFNVGVLSPGMHTIRAFPSFSWHESMKSPEAFATRTFFVGQAPKPNTAQENNLNGPLLTYSRPKGTYSGAEGAKVLLDFYVSNATVAPDTYHIKLWIDGAAMPDITAWQPYYIEGLSTGKHTIHLQLVAPNGSVVPGPFNSPSEEITISN
ncbi:MAG: hypothetical protein ACHQNE_07410 [Candidatus Kapaibacterium sp.]